MLKRVKSFTLFELLIVVSIIGVSYGIFTQKLKARKHNTKITLDNFISEILRLKFNKTAFLICLKEEKKHGCRVYLDKKLSKNNIKLFDKDDDISLYYLKNSNFEKQELKPFYEKNEYKDAIFKLKLTQNGGHKMFLLQKNDTFYLYNSYSKVMKFDDEFQALEFIQKDKELLKDLKSI